MKKIILIDDDIVLRQTLSARLREAGYTVLEAAHGGEAIHHVRMQQVDLVITDMLMPEMEGVETIRALRYYFPALKIIAMSGGGTVSGDCYLRIARELGARKTLTKPFPPVDLIAAVEELLGTSGAGN